MNFSRWQWITVVLVAAASVPLHAQAADCTYDRCALRLQRRGNGIRLVQGQGASSVARIGLFAPQISLLAEAPDSARSHYEAFRRHHNRAAKLGLGAFGALVVASVLYNGFEDDGPRWAGVAVLAVGFGLSLGASSNGAKGADHLHQALWFYNRPLAGAR